MPNYKEIVPFILRWEGGEVNDPADSGGHTNKGITRDTFNLLSQKVLGKAPTLANFRGMTRSDAELFIKHFWDKATYNNSIRSQKIAETLTTWFWGSGATGLKNFQRLVNTTFNKNLTIDGVIGKNTAAIINSVDHDKLFNEALKAREQFFRNLAARRPKDQKFLRGWLNRLNDFTNRWKKKL